MSFDLRVQHGSFDSTTFDVLVSSDKAREVFKDITGFGVTKSQLPAFAVEMRVKYDLIVG